MEGSGMSNQRILFLYLLGLTVLCGPCFADITLQGVAGGDVATSTLTATLPSADFFYLTFDGGDPNTPAPAWLSATPSEGYTNVQIQVFADPLKLQAGTYKARIVINYPNQNTSSVQNVTFQVSSAPAQLDVSPQPVKLTATLAFGTNVTASVPLFLRNTGGGGPQPFTASVVGTGDTSYLTVTPASGQTNQNSPALTIQASTKGTMKAGAYTNAQVLIKSGNQTQTVPVTFLVTANPTFFALSQSGFLFTAQQNVGTAKTESLELLTGSGPVNWTTTVTSTQDFVSLSATTGTTSSASPSKLTVGIKTNNLPPNGYTALVTVTPQASGLSPVYFTVVFIVTSNPAPPDFQTAGLIFVTNQGTSPAAQNLLLLESSSMPQAYTLGIGGNFADVPKLTGTVSGSAQLTVTVDSTGLMPGIYRGSIQATVSQLGVTRTADLALIVLPAGAKTNLFPQASGCTPTQLAVVGTGVAGGFSAPAGWPTPVQVRVVDNCANAVANANVVMSFSNGDPPLQMLLEDAGTGAYAATWLASHTGGVTMTVRATAGGLAASTTTLGAVAPNTPIVLAPHGTLNNLYPQVGGPLAPGTIVAIYGSKLATSAAAPGQVPLPGFYLGTRILVGGLSAPLYYVSDGQLNAELPAELQPDTTYSIVVSSNGSYSVPDTVTISDTTPGVAQFSDGRLIAQHLDYTLVDSDHPAKAGETLIMYLGGMGATDPGVATGFAASLTDLTPVINPASVTVDGAPAGVVFAGMTPGAVGLYQIDFTVPLNAKAGNLNVVVTQSGTTSNMTTLPVVTQ